MDLGPAARQGLDTGNPVQRDSWPDDVDVYVVRRPDGKVVFFRGREWTPEAEDVLAEDWRVKERKAR